MRERLKAMWHSSQMKAVGVLHVLSGGALVLAGAVNDPTIKGLMQPMLSVQAFGYVMLASAVLLYIATPHECRHDEERH